MTAHKLCWEAGDMVFRAGSTTGSRLSRRRRGGIVPLKLTVSFAPSLSACMAMSTAPRHWPWLSCTLLSMLRFGSSQAVAVVDEDAVRLERLR
jgi:hypothetical protein